MKQKSCGGQIQNRLTALHLYYRWNDLLVGAPFYFNRQKGEGGAVYIYMNTGGRFETTPTTVLTGPPGSAFGIAVAAAGDLNQDGFQGKNDSWCSGQISGRTR